MTRSILKRGALASLLAGGFAASALASDLYVAGPTGEVWKGDSVVGGFTYFTCTCTGPVNSAALTKTHLLYGDIFGTIAKARLSDGMIENFFFSTNDNSAMVLDGADLLIGGTNKTVVRLNSNSGQISKTLNTPFDVQAMALGSPNLFIGSQNTFVHKGDKVNGGFTLVGACGGIVNSMALKGNTLYVGDITGKLYRKVGEGPLVYYIDVPSDATALAFDGNVLLVGGSDGKIHRVNPDTGQLLGTFNAPFAVGAMVIKNNACAADLNGDGAIDQTDLGILLPAFGVNALGDVDGDGDTDQSDLGILLAFFNTTCP
jgi:hypothetical protein